MLLRLIHLTERWKDNDSNLDVNTVHERIKNLTIIKEKINYD
ncbi:hypothetical protein ACJDT4_20660 [Clostridium neuense]|uniref:Uncharacterized protein n=1 Tax=Clostridium neuense TaxID=1728934 RepID=A0ABW8TPA9_9CLOT